jgi:hypothetical protein
LEGVWSVRFFENGKEKAVNGQTRRQSAAATGGITSPQIWGGAMWVKGRLWKMEGLQTMVFAKRTHRVLNAF